MCITFQNVLWHATLGQKPLCRLLWVLDHCSMDVHEHFWPCTLIQIYKTSSSHKFVIQAFYGRLVWKSMYSPSDPFLVTCHVSLEFLCNFTKWMETKGKFCQWVVSLSEHTVEMIYNSSYCQLMAEVASVPTPLSVTPYTCCWNVNIHQMNTAQALRKDMTGNS